MSLNSTQASKFVNMFYDHRPPFCLKLQIDHRFQSRTRACSGNLRQTGYALGYTLVFIHLFFKEYHRQSVCTWD